MLLAFVWEGPGMLLNISQCMGEAHTTKNYLVQNVSSSKVENPSADKNFTMSFDRKNMAISMIVK